MNQAHDGVTFSLAASLVAEAARASGEEHQSQRASASAWTNDSTCSDIYDLSCLLFPPPGVQDQILGMITVYLDDSGTHEESKYCACGGFMAHVRDWEKFELGWKSLLGEYKIPYVRGSDIAGRRKHFEGWTAPKRNAFVNEMAKVLSGIKAEGVCCSILKSDYDAVHTTEIMKASGDTAFGICFRTVMMKMANIAKKKYPGEKIGFVVEQGSAGNNAINRIFTHSRFTPWSRVNVPLDRIAFVPKQEFGALQISDFLTFNQLKNIEAIKHGQKPHKDFDDFLVNCKVPVIGYQQTQAAMQSVWDNARKEIQREMTETWQEIVAAQIKSRSKK